MAEIKAKLDGPNVVLPAVRKHALKATLAELPKQLTDFFQTKKINPNPK